MIEHKDVIVTLLGASAGLSGFVLVFLGVVVTAYQGYAADTSPKVLRRYQRSALIALVAFGVGLLCVAIAAAWLIDRHDNQRLYLLTMWTFAGQLALLAVATGRVVRQALWS